MPSPYRADVPEAPVTPKALFFDRRSFLRATAAAGLALGPISCAPSSSREPTRIEPARRWPDGFSLKDGAPVRVHVPWKYGYKSPKSLPAVSRQGPTPGLAPGGALIPHG